MYFKSIEKVSSWMPFKALVRMCSPRVISLVYHVVGDKAELPYLDSLYSIPSPEQFETDLDFILKHYKPLSLSELIDYTQTRKLPGKGKFFFLSFDDGLKQCEEVIAPILKQKGISATFFLNTSFIDNKAFLHRFKTVLISKQILKSNNGDLKTKAEQFFKKSFSSNIEAADEVFKLRYPQKKLINSLAQHLEMNIDGTLRGYAPYMSKEAINILVAQGHSVGAHSLDHPEFYLLTEEEQTYQVVESIKQVDKLFKPTHKVFAFPFTDVGVKKSFFKSLEKKTDLDLSFASSGIKKDKQKNNVHRIAMDDEDLSAERRLKYELFYYALKAPLGKNHYKRK